MVLGGGIAGTSAAFHLAQRGYRVVLLEARTVGYGASGRSGGQTIFGLAASQKTLESQVGKADARRLFDLSVEALDLTQQLIREHHIDCDYRPNHVHVGLKPRHIEELKAWETELHEDYGYTSARFLDRAQVQEHVRSLRYVAGLIDPRSGHLHTLKYTQGVARAAEAAGALIYDNTPVLRYEDGPTVAVHTPTGTVRAAHLVLCGNAYIGRVAPIWRDASSASARISSPASHLAPNAPSACFLATPPSLTSTGYWITSAAPPMTVCCSAVGSATAPCSRLSWRNRCASAWCGYSPAWPT